jgi:hypothetical protein
VADIELDGVTARAALDVYYATVAQGALADTATQPGDLGTAAAQDVAAFDAAGSAAAAEAASQPLAAVLTATTASFLTADETKLDGIESLADVTDTANVTAAGALMDSEVDADIKTLVLPASTTITAAAATVLDDISTAAMLTTLGAATAAQGATADAALQTVAVPADITATGTASSTTYLRGDGAWATPAGGGGSGDLLAANNLSELTNFTTARSNLGLGTAAAAATTDFATAAEGTLASTAMQPVTYDAAGIAQQVVGTTAAQDITSKSIKDFSNIIHADSTHQRVRNESGGTITAGMAVYVSGFSVGQALPLVQLADATFPLGVTEPVVGIAFESIANNASGGIISFGAVSNIDTSAFSAGDVLFMSTTPGVLTNVKPTGNAAVQRVAQVLRSHATLGRITVVGAGRINDLPNFSAADKFWYGAAGGTEVEGDITAAGRELLNDADATAQRATLGLGTAATTASTAYATSAQGALATSALQRLAGGASVINIGAVEENVDVASVTTTKVFNASLYGRAVYTMTGNTTFSISNPAQAGKASTFVMRIKGVFTPTLPASFDFVGGAAAAYVGTNGGTSYVGTTEDEGVTYQVSVLAGWA